MSQMHGVRIVFIVAVCTCAAFDDERDSNRQLLPVTEIESDGDTTSSHPMDGNAAAVTNTDASAAMLEALKQLGKPGTVATAMLHKVSMANRTLMAEGTPRAVGLLVMMKIFGIPVDTNAPAEASGLGLSRDAEEAASILIQQVTKKGASREDPWTATAHTLLGFLLAIGHQNVTAAARMRNLAEGKFSLTFDLQALQGKRDLIYIGLRPEENDTDANDTNAPESGWDLSAISYWMAAKNGDVFGSLAFGFYSLHGLTQSPDLLTPPGAATHGPSLPRQPRLPINVLNNSEGNETMLEKCRVALSLLNGHVKYCASRPARDSDGDPERQAVQFRVPILNGKSRTNRQFYESKDHADAAKFGADQNHAGSLHTQGQMEFQGHYASNQAANLSKAVETWTLAAKQGHGHSAWTLLLLHLRGDLGTGTNGLQELIPLVTTIKASSDAGPDQKAFATYLQFKHGLGVGKDPVEAGIWLEKSAELGELNAQLMMADAYAGVADFANLVSSGPPAVVASSAGLKINRSLTDQQKLHRSKLTLQKNDSRALYFWRAALQRGVPRAHINIIQFVLAGRDPDYPTECEQCLQAYRHARELIMTEHPLLLMMHTLARRAFVNDDFAGSLLLYSFLSELGSSIAARNAADLWTVHSQKPNSFSPAIPCVVDASGTIAPSSECALFFLRRAAALGDIEAMNLASAAERAAGNDAAAYDWASRAAERGSERGRFERAMMLGLGTKVLKANSTSALAELQKLREEAMDSATAFAAFIGLFRIQAAETLGMDELGMLAFIATALVGLLTYVVLRVTSR